MVDHLDLSGLVCPMPLIRLTEVMTVLTAGKTLRITADDPGFADDLPAWCQETGVQLLQLTDKDDGRIEAVVAKT